MEPVQILEERLCLGHVVYSLFPSLRRRLSGVFLGEKERVAFVPMPQGSDHPLRTAPFPKSQGHDKGIQSPATSVKGPQPGDSKVPSQEQEEQPGKPDPESPAST